MKNNLDKVILDIGCGPYHLPYFDTKVIRLDMRKEVKPDILHDVRKGIPLKSNSIDIVYCSHFLEHFKQIEIEGIIKEVYRVLKPKGRFHVTVPNIDWAAMQISKGIFDDYVDKVLYGAQDYELNLHQRGFTPITLEKILKNNNFSIMHTTTQFYNINTIAKVNK